MTFQEFLEFIFIKEEDERLIKLMEEVGEFAREVLMNDGDQRKEKLEKMDKKIYPLNLLM